MEKKDILISVCTVTYNHEKFIAQAIESVLAQRCDYKIEMIIGEDCSTDGTAAIVRSYQEKYPDIIKPIFHNPNIGAQNNSIYCLKSCRGKYIAALEGDDYWTDPLKLQKQVHFLESNPQYAIIFHRVKLESNGKFEASSLNESVKEESYTLRDLADHNFIHTPSVVFRNGLLKEFPSWLYTSHVGDYALHMLNARYGNIKYNPEFMAVYRQHIGGTWSLKSRTVHLENWLSLLKGLLTEDFPSEILNILNEKKKLTENGYLHLLLSENMDLFREKLQLFILEDPGLGQEWLFQYYPEYISTLKSSKSYVLAQKLSALKRRIVKR